jgi:hypothetical protein
MPKPGSFGLDAAREGDGTDRCVGRSEPMISVGFLPCPGDGELAAGEGGRCASPAGSRGTSWDIIEASSFPGGAALGVRRRWSSINRGEQAQRHAQAATSPTRQRRQARGEPGAARRQGPKL